MSQKRDWEKLRQQLLTSWCRSSLIIIGTTVLKSIAKILTLAMPDCKGNWNLMEDDKLVYNDIIYNDKFRYIISV